MINRKPLRCSTCKRCITTRAAIGHDDYQEFAFPCPGCGIEIRFGMTLDQINVRIEYSKVVNAEWDNDESPSADVLTFDGENLLPLKQHMLSPFIQTFHLPTDVRRFLQNQAMRRHFVGAIWPKLERALVHLERRQFEFFEKEMREFEYEQPLTTDREREVAVTWAFDLYGTVFCAPDSTPMDLVRARLEQAERRAPSAIADVVAYFKSKNRHISMNVELLGIRRQWVRLMFLLPIYNVYYWDSTQHSLDEFTIGQKRFDELKPFYVDCFETLSRISAIAAAVEGAIENGVANVPTKKGMSIGQFEAMPNGSKPGVLKNLAIADLFVPFMDHHLRNGMGHNAARYDVVTDVVHYANENEKTKTEYQVPYVRFCEQVVRIYGQLEIVARYTSWLRVRCA